MLLLWRLSLLRRKVKICLIEIKKILKIEDFSIWWEKLLNFNVYAFCASNKNRFQIEQNFLLFLRFRARLFSIFPFLSTLPRVYTLNTHRKRALFFVQWRKNAPRTVFPSDVRKAHAHHHQHHLSFRLHVTHLMHTKKKLEKFHPVRGRERERRRRRMRDFFMFSCTYYIRLSVPFLIVSVRVVSLWIATKNVVRTKKVPKMHT